jgi:hypothetical protein
MTLSLLLAQRPSKRRPVVLADPAGASIEPLLAGLIGQLGETRRLMFPLPDETTRRHVSPASLVRSRHADLWHGLSADERIRVRVVAGPTAAYIAPLVEGGATTIVEMPDPGRIKDAWRSVLGPFADLDEVPEEPGSEEERDRWLDRIRTATSQFEMIRAADVASLTMEVAAGLGLGPKGRERAATLATSTAGDTDGPRGRDRPGHWLDGALYELSRPPDGQGPGKRRSGSGGSSSPAGGPAKSAQRRRRHGSSSGHAARTGQRSRKQGKGKKRRGA